MHYFYSENSFDQSFILEGEEAGHAHVLRLKPAETIAILNGKGTKYIAEIVEVEKKKVSGRILEKKEIPKAGIQLSIALSPTKNIDRYEWFIEKATELGVQSFIPLIAFQSERRNLNMDRLRKIILSAMKQSGRAYMPTIIEPILLKEFLFAHIADKKFIAHISGKPFNEYIKAIPPNAGVSIMIGPEGDFTEDELSLALNGGWLPVSLGDYRLRTETAGLKAAAMLV